MATQSNFSHCNIFTLVSIVLFLTAVERKLYGWFKLFMFLIHVILSDRWKESNWTFIYGFMTWKNFTENNNNKNKGFSCKLLNAGCLKNFQWQNLELTILNVQKLKNDWFVSKIFKLNFLIKVVLTWAGNLISISMSPYYVMQNCKFWQDGEHVVFRS